MYTLREYEQAAAAKQSKAKQIKNKTGPKKGLGHEMWWRSLSS
jgi:hypothetical protein